MRVLDPQELDEVHDGQPSITNTGSENRTCVFCKHSKYHEPRWSYCSKNMLAFGSVCLEIFGCVVVVCLMVWLPRFFCCCCCFIVVLLSPSLS